MVSSHPKITTDHVNRIQSEALKHYIRPRSTYLANQPILYGVPSGERGGEMLLRHFHRGSDLPQATSSDCATLRDLA